MTEQPIHWETDGTSRIPFAVYTDEDRHKKELERFFYKSHWSYVGLEAEIPNVGDFKRTVVGERSVIMTRASDGQIHVVENVCAHRGMQFCRERHGNKKEFVCPYHQWSYTLKGDLQGVPFRRGVRQDGKVNGGMPADFDPKDHGLTSLKVATRGGVVFASFDPNVESLEDFMGSTILTYFDRLFNGRKLVVLGYNRQRIPGNWKLMQENIKDPYHPGLLHTWFVTFGLWRADNKSELRMDAHHRHAAMGAGGVLQHLPDARGGLAGRSAVAQQQAVGGQGQAGVLQHQRRPNRVVQGDAADARRIGRRCTLQQHFEFGGEGAGFVREVRPLVRRLGEVRAERTEGHGVG